MAKKYAEDLKELIYTYVVPALEFLRIRMREILTSVDSALLCKFLRLMDWWLLPLAGRDNKPPPAPQFLDLIRKILFCLKFFWYF